MSIPQVLPELRACVSAVVSTFDLSSVTCSLRALLEVGVSSGSGLVRIVQNEFGSRVVNELLLKGSTLSKLCNGSNLQEDDLEVWYVSHVSRLHNKGTFGTLKELYLTKG